MRDPALIALLVLTCAARVAAQDVPREGDLVEARITESADSAPVRFCSAPLAAMAGDTLMLERSESCAAGRHRAHVRYERVDRGLRLKHAGLGMLLGVVAGGVIGRASAGCRIDGCDLSDARSMNMVAGGLIGSAIGTLIGVAWPAGGR